MLSVREQFAYASEAESREIDVLAGAGCIGETITLSFSLESSENNSEVEITATALTGATGLIPPDAIQLYVVHVWNQAGIGIYQSAPVAVRELLLKDDRVPLSCRYRRQFRHWRHFLKPSYRFCAPQLRLEGPVRTSLTRSVAKQIWININLPRDCAAGMFEGQIKIAGQQEKSIGLKIEVMPIKLEEATQERLIWYRGKLDWRDPQHFVGEENFRAQLRDIRAHGFTSVSISETDRTLAQRAIELVEEAGFNRSLVFLPPFPGDPHTLKFTSVTPVVYLSDEIDIRLAFPQPDLADPVNFHKTNWQRAADWKMKSMASLVSQTFARRLFDAKDLGHAPNILSYFLPKNREFVHLNKNIEHSDSSRAQNFFYYWHAYMEKPNLHRVLSGVYLWKSGFDGISPYCYQHMPQYPFSPFNDFDEWEPKFHVGPVRKPFKDHMVTYPAATGSIPTIQWEGFRDGIIDLRTLATLDSALNDVDQNRTNQTHELSEKHRNLLESVRRRRDNFLAKVNLRRIKITSETESEPYPDILPRDYQTFREDNMRDILLLQNLLNEKHAQS